MNPAPEPDGLPREAGSNGPVSTPFYLIDESVLLKNLGVIEAVRRLSGARCLLALKAFSTWSVFPLLAGSMDGTTSSSLNEARLGHEFFGGETHAFSTAFPDSEIAQLARFADKVIFNSVTQLERHHHSLPGLPLGLRVNPGISHSHFPLADPACRYSRLGVAGVGEIENVLPLISGLMFHYNCENDDFAEFSASLDFLAGRYGHILSAMEWISLGGGVLFTKEGYPLEDFCELLKNFARRFSLQIYLEPGEAVLHLSTELVVSVLDIVHNGKDTAIVDASFEAHLPDSFLFRVSPRMAHPPPGTLRHYLVAGRTCLAGDVFGEYGVDRELAPGDVIRFADTGAYSMVKRSWFNGIPAPAVVVRTRNGRTVPVRVFTYDDFVANLS